MSTGAPLRDVEHLIRLAVLIVAAVAVFLVARSLLVPDTFGVYGHYRAAALDDVRAQEPVYAGGRACAECHDDVVESRAGGGHEALSCETCHGPLGTHAAAPFDVAPVLPEHADCATCHAYSAYRPEWFPQVVVADHAGDVGCGDCHEPHRPSLD